MHPRPRCWQCRAILELDVGRPVGRSEACPECDADVRCCRACAHWEASSRACREPTAEVPADAERRNFCQAFSLAAPRAIEIDGARPGPATSSTASMSVEGAKARLEALFKK